MCNQCGAVKHLGWKFTHKLDPSKSFFGLIVSSVEEREAEREGESTEVLKVAEKLLLGIDAPSWITALTAVYLPMLSANRIL